MEPTALSEKIPHTSTILKLAAFANLVILLYGMSSFADRYYSVFPFCPRKPSKK